MFLSEEQWQEVTELLGSLVLLEYPDNYDPINDPNSDTITSSKYDDKAQQFLDVCESLRKIITSSEEWKALPEYEFFYE